MRRSTFSSLIFLAAVLLSACQPASESGEDPLAPGAAGEGSLPTEGGEPVLNPDSESGKKVRGPATVQESGILLEKDVAVLSLTGTLPTPCHELSVQIAPPDDQNRIRVEVFSLVDPEQICIQVLQGFEERVPLSGLAAGTYTVALEGKEIGQFTLP